MPEIPHQNPEAPKAETQRTAEPKISSEQQRADRVAELSVQLEADKALFSPDQNRLNLGSGLRKTEKNRMELATLQVAALEDQRRSETDPNKRLEIFKQQQELRKQAEQAKANLELLDVNLKAAEAKKIDAAAQHAKEIAAPLAVSGKLTPERLTRVDLEAMNADAKFAREPGGEGKKFDPNKRISMPAISEELIAAAQRGALAPDASIMREVSPLSADNDAEKLPPTSPQKKPGLFSRIFG